MFEVQLMYKQLFAWLMAVTLWSSCSNNSPSIFVVCEEKFDVGKKNNIIKWETTPAVEGKVKIYASTDPDDIPEKKPVFTADISDQLAIIAVSNPTRRYYYKLVFNNRYRVVTASRNVVIPGVQNLRDLGGYPARKGKEVRWGMIYRSSQIENLSLRTLEEFQNIGIKTIIDFRTLDESTEIHAIDNQVFNVVQLPIGVLNMSQVLDDLRKGKIANDSVYNLMIRANCEMVTFYRGKYKKMFEILKEEENYPLLICSTGVGRTAIASALILSTLGVNDDAIMSDYLRNNTYFDIPRASGFGYELPVSTQEAITTLFSARRDFLKAAKSQIEKNYGNIPTYLKKGLGMNDGNIKDLQHFLLQ